MPDDKHYTPGRDSSLSAYHFCLGYRQRSTQMNGFKKDFIKQATRRIG
jgi:hypothetical protein